MCREKTLIEVLKILQEPIPLIPNPFSYYAQKIDISEAEVIRLIKEYIDKDIIRRFSAILKHNKAGFIANTMVVIKVEEEEVDRIGSELAKFKFITHCYKRTIYPDWQYSLYAMVHAKTEGELEKYLEQIKIVIDNREMVTLRSLKEYKKVRFRI